MGAACSGEQSWSRSGGAAPGYC
uniref:Uncharacterized protein n=1 Tax=Macrostomum lignano TaxID=282301 RepID=A0A1I8IJ89_9PLAT